MEKTPISYSGGAENTFAAHYQHRERTPSMRAQRRAETLAAVDPSEVHVANRLYLQDVMDIRNDVRSGDEDSLAERIRQRVDTELPMPANENDSLYRATQRDRGVLMDALSRDDDAFDKQANWFKKRYLRETQVGPVARRVEAIRTRRTEAGKVNRELKELGKRYPGNLIPNLAKAGWNEDELRQVSSKYDELTSDGYIVSHGGDINSESPYKDGANIASRKFIDAKVDAIAASEGFATKEDEKAYREQLRSDIYGYARLNNEDRLVTVKAMDRYRELQSQIENRERLPRRALNRAKTMGAAALAFFDKIDEAVATPVEGMVHGAGNLRERWAKHRENRRAEKTGQVVGQLEMIDDQGNVIDDTAEKRRWRDIPLAAFTGLQARRAAKNQAEQARVATMNDTERKDYEQKKRQERRVKGTAVTIGATGVALAAAIAAARTGMFTGGSGNTAHHAETAQQFGVDQLPGGHTPAETGTELPPVKPPVTPETTEHQNTVISAADFFSGDKGTTRFSEKGVPEVMKWLDGQHFDKGDNVWDDIAHDYLVENGVKNPSIAQIDAVKDAVMPELRSHKIVDSRGWLPEDYTVHFK
jgi:hypothetical protein